MLMNVIYLIPQTCNYLINIFDIYVFYLKYGVGYCSYLLHCTGEK
jgi:hypothetical protein